MYATYFWKIINESYNFSLDHMLIKDLHKKLGASKVARNPNLKIMGFPTSESKEKCHLGVTPIVMTFLVRECYGSPKISIKFVKIHQNLLKFIKIHARRML
jgi:hypothetical protein